MANPLTDLERVRAFNFKRQGLFDECRFKGIQDAVAAMVGLHSARLSTPFVALAARLPLFRPQHLIEELYVRANLIKLRCMRKTLHTVPLSMAPVVHQATRSYRLRDCTSFYRRNRIAPGTLARLRNSVLSLVSRAPLTSAQIVAHLQGQRSVPVELGRAVIKQLWEEGHLCYVNRAQSWRKESRAYASTAANYPLLNLEAISLREAQERLILWHIESYGPVTEQDVAWWSGLPRSLVHETIVRHAPAVTAVGVAGFGTAFYISRADVPVLLKTRRMDGCFRLLAHEDPLLKAYHHSRARYVGMVDYERLFNPIGEARAGIFKNGVAIGTWEWRDGKDIELSFFGRVTVPERRVIEQEAARITAALGLRDDAAVSRVAGRRS